MNNDNTIPTVQDPLPIEDSGGDRLDVEREEQEDEPDFRSPYDPKAIRVDPRVYSVRQVLDMIQDGELDLAPDFQRLRVWKRRQKSALIESLLLRIPLPAFYFSSDEEGNLQVVDGVQRLSTIYDFVRRDEFTLHPLEYLDDIVGGKSYHDIENTIWSRRILNTQINAFVIDPQTPTAVKFDIFKRINTGGTPLTSQEIRHCMSRARSRDFLRALADEPVFNEITNYVFRHHLRMVDRELALRFVAFRRLSSIHEYELYGSIEDFLNSANTALDRPSDTPDSVLEDLRDSFDLAMRNARTVFGFHAFRKWYTESDEMNPVNRALFDVWSVELSKCPDGSVNRVAGEIQSRARQMMSNDREFIDAISTSTGSPRRVVTRFRKVQKLISAFL